MAMNNGSNMRRARQSRPGLEHLEGRELLSAGTTDLTASQASASSTGSAATERVRALEYTTPVGTHVVVTLYGAGSLAGSTLDSDGALNLVFSGTNEQSGIVGKVHGGDGLAPLRSVKYLLLPAQSVSGVGSSLLNLVNLKDFDLVDGGRINLTGGVHSLFLNSVAGNTQVSLRELPETTLPTTTGSSTATLNGVTLGYSTDATGGQTLTSVSGQFVPGANVVPTVVSSPITGSNPGPPPAPPGVAVSINHVNGPPRSALMVGDPEIFGYDPVQNALIRFDTTTGNPVLTIPNALPIAATDAGVTLGRNNGQLVVLISDGSNVYAYNPLDGSKVGQFSTDTLMAVGIGLTNPTRLGTFDSRTVISDPNAGASGLGLIQPIDVTQSLLSGHAQRSISPQTGVPVAPYASQRLFGLSGGLTGLPGLNTLFAAGAAHFDAFQPTQYQLGVASLSPTTPSIATGGASLREASRAAVSVNGKPVVVNDVHGGQGSQRNNALGSVNELLALDTGLGVNPITGQVFNKVSLFSSSGLSQQRQISLNDANVLSDLSATFLPDVAGTALVDVQGNTQSFRAHDVRGLVFNGEGNVNLVKINDAVDSVILGFPFGHAQIPHRTNIAILSSGRSVGSRNGVTVVPSIQPTGPLSLP
jgi:hypothetical protein